MSVVVTVSNELNLRKLKNFLGAKDESEAIDIAIEKIVQDFESKMESEELEDEIDVHSLNRIPPNKTIRVMAKVRFGERGKPLKYDLSDYNFDEYETEESS